MKTLFVKDLTPGLIINKETFVVAEVKSATDRNGKPYYDVLLMDKTGSIKAKIWGDSFSNVEKAALVMNHIVAVEARVDEFRGVNQLTISKLFGVDDVKMDDYIETSMFPVEDMWKELTNEVNSLSNPHLKQLGLNLLQHPEWSTRLQQWPAARDIHHDFHAGLLQHILEMISISKGLTRFYPMADFNLLTIGIIFHDIGKLQELDGSGIKAEYTSLGSLMGHIALGIEMVQQILPEDFPEDLLWCVKHLILSHHGSLEYGSPVMPSTIEAIMLCYIDNLSAKSRTAEHVLREVNKDNVWSTYNRWLETRLYGGLTLGTDINASVEDPLNETASAVVLPID